MPDIDRDVLNRALAEKLKDEHGYDHWALPDGVHRTPKEFCYSLDAAVAALNALGLSYTPVVGHGIPHVTVEIPRLGAYETRYATDTTPAALATALVQAALALLEREEENDETC